jgi:hypothetical protein
MKTNIALILIGLLVGGCVIVPPYHQVDFGKTPEGKIFIRDTPRTWAYFTDGYNKAITAELEGQEIYGGMKSWSENWLRVFNSLRNDDQENPDKYITYIVERRREFGLPEIVYPSPQTSPPL